jgi:hypothetical protein
MCLALGRFGFSRTSECVFRKYMLGKALCGLSAISSFSRDELDGIHVYKGHLENFLQAESRYSTDTLSWGHGVELEERQSSMGEGECRYHASARFGVG